MREILIRGDMIELAALLKLGLCVQSGGEAKALVQAGQILVNGVTETRRHRQLHQGDIVTCPDGTLLRVVTEGRPG